MDTELPASVSHQEPEKMVRFMVALVADEPRAIGGKLYIFPESQQGWELVQATPQELQELRQHGYDALVSDCEMAPAKSTVR
jgi:hypothetical protein